MRIYLSGEVGFLARLAQAVRRKSSDSPAGVIHGYENASLAPTYVQIMLGRGRPETMGYADEDFYKRRDQHVKAAE